jgi:enoyl-CoA hydratase
MSYETLVIERQADIAIVRLSRPHARNALSAQMMGELREALDHLEDEQAIGAIVITGDDRAFAAGADIKEMADMDYVDAYMGDFITKDWERLAACRKPTIAAVAGYALGGGCELAMMADMILAADTAKFGQPEITIGTIPGAGGTQRLTRAVGKAKAMEMCMTGRLMTAEEAERAGLVARVVAADQLVDEATQTARKIAGLSRPAIFAIKEAVNRAFETSLSEGLLFERRTFHATFALEDRSEGMKAFSEKREAHFKNR